MCSVQPDIVCRTPSWEGVLVSVILPSDLLVLNCSVQSARVIAQYASLDNLLRPFLAHKKRLQCHITSLSHAFHCCGVGDVWPFCFVVSLSTFIVLCFSLLCDFHTCSFFYGLVLHSFFTNVRTDKQAEKHTETWTGTCGRCACREGKLSREPEW